MDRAPFVCLAVDNFGSVSSSFVVYRSSSTVQHNVGTVAVAVVFSSSAQCYRVHHSSGQYIMLLKESREAILIENKQRAVSVVS